MNTTANAGAKVGAAIGAILYPFVGAFPAFYFGSYGALILMSKLTGSLEPTLLVRMGVIAGSMIGLAAVACLFLVMGGLFGAMIGLAVHTATVEVVEQK